MPLRGNVGPAPQRMLGPTRSLVRQFLFPLAALVFAPALGCNQGTAFDGGALLTELHLQNDSSMDLDASWTVGGGNITGDGETIAPTGERTLLIKEVDGVVLLPSEILASLTLRAQGESEPLFELVDIDDEAWTADSVDAVKAQYTLVITDADLTVP